MPSRRRQFRRPLGHRRYRKLFVIAVEGTKTEPQYFAIFNGPQATVWVNCLKGKNDSSPPQVLQRMAAHIAQKGLKASDEAWLVVDKDSWTDAQLRELWQWACAATDRGFALSNPKFEYWLLLHFENGTGIASSSDCPVRLERHLPGYGKGIDARKIKPHMIADAVHRAKSRDNPPCTDWPRNLSQTTVYRLVEKIQGA